MAKEPEIIISDHALLRYVERILGLDMAQLRRKLTIEVAPAARAGAKSFTKGKATYLFEKTPDGNICMVTVITDKMRKGTHPRQEHKRLAERRAR